ncbi:hypothetical protein C8Q75DRAFT_810319 [Abortiporus biennis]|nr:hypothetical protein C8Q75DRAFT_810319 [Abortiporus biennis]
MASQVSLDDWRKLIAIGKKKLDNFEKKNKRTVNPLFGGDVDDVDTEPLVDVCRVLIKLVRRAEAEKHAELKEIIEQVHEVINIALGIAYGPGHFFNFMPSYAHNNQDPILKDTQGAVLAQTMMGFLNNFMSQLGVSPGGEKDFPGLRNLAAEWPTSKPLHPKSTPLSRFRDIPPSGLSVSSSTPTAQIFYQARCEIKDESICKPIRMSISSDNSCLAYVGCGGYRNLDPKLELLILDGSGGDECHFVESGLSAVAPHLTMEAERKLVFVADRYRIKSFTWEKNLEVKGDEDPYGSPVHTLNSKDFNGPLEVLPNGRVIRSGTGQAGVWNIDQLDTHGLGPKKKRIGPGKFSSQNVYRDLGSDDDMEWSTGNPAHSTLSFSELGEDIRIGTWKFHSSTGHMLCTESTVPASKDSSMNKYSCVSMDIEHGAKMVTRYLGHGGGVYEFSTDEAGDPKTFITACSDGYVRMFDIRRPCPVLTFDSEKNSAFCYSALYMHPDGIPTVITGGNKTECLQVWDVRAKQLVYDLSTGNNIVQGMAWDTEHTTLYAVTECSYVDWMGGSHGYRDARIPKYMRTPTQGEEGKKEEDTKKKESKRHENEDDDESSEEDDSDIEPGVYWPEGAWHQENYYGKLYDAGSHTLLKYVFKEDPDIEIVPKSGWIVFPDDDFF